MKKEKATISKITCDRVSEIGRTNGTGVTVRDLVPAISAIAKVVVYLLAREKELQAEIDKINDIRRQAARRMGEETDAMYGVH